MIKRYEPYQRRTVVGLRLKSMWVKHDDHLAECERRVAEEREKWQTEVQRLHASIEILDSLNPSERIRADERERMLQAAKAGLSKSQYDELLEALTRNLNT